VLVIVESNRGNLEIAVDQGLANDSGRSFSRCFAIGLGHSAVLSVDFLGTSLIPYLFPLDGSGIILLCGTLPTRLSLESYI
jgi:hypothetical protein